MKVSKRKILLFIFGCLLLGLLISAFDIGDYSDECSEGEVAKVVGGEWSCIAADNHTIERTTIETATHKNLTIKWSFS